MKFTEFLNKLTLPAPNIKSTEGIMPISSVPFSSSLFGSLFGITHDEATTLADGLYYSKVGSVYRAVNVIAQSIAQQPLIAEKFSQKDEAWIDITDKKEFLILNKPNRFQTTYDFWELSMMLLELKGACPYLLKRLKNGRITEMLPFDPDMLTVVSNNDFVIDHYKLNLNGSLIRLEQDDIFLLKYTNPEDPTGWISPISAATRDIKLDLYAVYSSEQTFKNGSRPSGILSTDQKIDPGQFNKIVEQIQEKIQGMSKAGNILPIGNNFKYQPLSVPSKDMQLVEQREWTHQTVSEVFGVPPIYLMHFKEASVLANADVQEKLLWHTLLPKIRKIEAIINRFWMPMIVGTFPDQRIRFDLSDVKALRGDQEAKSRLFKEGFSMGAISPNEYRYHVLGLKTVDDPDLDSFYLPFSIAPVGQRPVDKSDKILDEIISKTSGSTKAILYNIKKKDEETELELEKIKASREVLKRADNIADEFKKDLIKLFKDQKEEVVKNLLKQKKKTTHEVTGVIFDFDEWAEKFEKAGKPYIAQSIRESAASLATELGDIIDVTHPDIVNFINQQAIQYATIVNDTTVEEIDKIIGKGLVDGLNIEDIAENIAGYFEAQSEMRSLRIARTESVRASNKGRLEAMKQSDKVSNNIWVTSRDEDVRDKHYDMEGRVVKVGANFDCQDPTMADQTYPSAINERCIAMPTDLKINYGD